MSHLGGGAGLSQTPALQQWADAPLWGEHWSEVTLVSVVPSVLVRVPFSVRMKPCARVTMFSIYKEGNVERDTV